MQLAALVAALPLPVLLADQLPGAAASFTASCLLWKSTFPLLPSLTCTHPWRTPWIYALFIPSLPCRLKCFRSADCLSSISAVRPLKSRREKKKKKALQTNWREVQIRMRQADKCSSGSHYTAGFVTTHKDWLGKHNSWIIRSVSFAGFLFCCFCFWRWRRKISQSLSWAAELHRRRFCHHESFTGLLSVLRFRRAVRRWCSDSLALFFRCAFSRFLRLSSRCLDDAASSNFSAIHHHFDWNPARCVEVFGSQTASRVTLWMTDEQYLFFFFLFSHALTGLTIGLDSVLCGKHDAQNKTFNVSLTEMLGQ